MAENHQLVGYANNIFFSFRWLSIEKLEKKCFWGHFLLFSWCSKSTVATAMVVKDMLTYYSTFHFNQNQDTKMRWLLNLLIIFVNPTLCQVCGSFLESHQQSHCTELLLKWFIEARKQLLHNCSAQCLQSNNLHYKFLFFC